MRGELKGGYFGVVGVRGDVFIGCGAGEGGGREGPETDCAFRFIVP